MEKPPETIDRATVLFSLELHESTTPVKALVLARYPNQQSFYLFYCDEHWETLNDSPVASLEQAKSGVARRYPEAVTREWTPSNHLVPIVAPEWRDVDDDELRAVVGADGQLAGIALLRTCEGVSLFDATARVKAL